jgi:hypothetical protein
MAIGTAEVGAPVRLTSSGVVAGGTAMARTFPGGGNDPGSVAETTALQGCILGFYVNNTSAGTLVLSTNNAGAAGTAFTGTITPAIGWNFLPVVSAGGIFATIGGTLDVTFVVVE